MKNLLSEKSTATPVKILMANDMSNEIELKGKYHSVVAQLMGIDNMKLDQQQVSIHNKRKLQDNCPSTTLAGELKVCCQKDKFCSEMSRKLQHYISDKIEFKDACEILHKPLGDIKNQWGNCIKDLNKNNKKAYVGNLMEGSFSAEDKRILHSKDFQDALRIVRSNRKLFLKILQGPDFRLSKHMRNAPITPVKKDHIFAFKPLQNFDKGENVATTERYPSGSKCGRQTVNSVSNNVSDFTQLKAKNVSRQTRIAVLKPRSGKHHVMKAKVTSPMTLCKLLEQSGFFRGMQDRGALQSRSESEVSQQKLKTVISCETEKTLSSSRSNNESLFDKLEIGNVEENIGLFCDLEAQASLYCLECNNTTCNSCSAISFCQTSISQKPAVVMEGKKQALERQASLPSNGSNKEQIQTHRSSLSLGQILANTVVKDAEHTDKFIPRNGSSCNPVDELKLSTSCETFGKINYIERRSSPGNLSRSKSLPISSSYEQIGSSSQSSKFLIINAIERKKELKSRNDKTFKEKISSFIFSKMKKFSYEKSASPFSEGFDSKSQSYSAGFAVKGSVQSVNPLKINLPLGSPQVYYEETTGNATFPNPIIDSKKRASSEKAKTCNTMGDELDFENSKGNQDQTSPTSVLETLFEDRRNDIISESSDVITGPQSISRAPPIETVSRSLPRDNTHPDFPIFNKESFKVDNNHEEDYVFSQNCISSSSEINNTVSTRSYAFGGQFDEVLLTSYFYWRETAAMRKGKRSNQNVLFNSINSEPIEFGSTGLPTSQNVNKWIRESAWFVPAEVWNIVRNSFLVKTVREDSDCSNISQLLDMMVGGYRLSEYLLEVQEIAEEISGYVLKNLVGDTLTEMSD